MRRQLYRTSWLVIAAVITLPSPATGGRLSWLDKLSGPGPFWGTDISVCLETFPTPEPDVPEGFVPAMVGIVISCKDALDRRHFSWYVSVGAAIAQDNDLRYEDTGTRGKSKAVRLLKFGTAVDYTLVPWLDLGAGAGFLYFAGSRFDNFALPYIEPLRVTIRPLLFRWKHLRSNRRKLEHRGWLLLSANWNVLIGRLDGASFGAPSDPFRAQNESNPEFGVAIDVVRLLNKRKGRKP